MQVFLGPGVLDTVSLRLSRQAEAHDRGKDAGLERMGWMKSSRTASGSVFYLPD